MKKIAFYTLGCRLNQSETAVIERTFDNGEYCVVDISQPADVVVVNTCTVTENGDTDTRRLVNKVCRINPRAKIALVGCQAQVQKERLLDLPNVRWVVGNARKMDFRQILAESKEDAEPQVIAPTIPRDAFTVPTAGIDTKHTRANIKIQDGCDFFCSFCEIPYARGRARSRNFEDILIESRALVAAGHKEIVITGINVGTYAESGRNILHVIDALEKIDNLMRIRISSIEPTTIPKELITRMAAPGSKLCRYLHIPLQSGHDEILTSMKRKYTLAEFDAFVRFADETVPEICIGTDVIVGFPGETDAHFAQTEEYLRNSAIDYFHVFSYSERTMAKSQHFADPVPAKTIQQRSEILRDLSRRKRELFHKTLIGTTQHVLFEQKKKGMWTGLTDNYVRAFVENDDNLENQFLPVEIIAASGQAVRAELAAALH